MENATETRRENQFSAATKSAETTLQALLLLNGGACVALLGVVASISANKDPQSLKEIIESLRGSLWWFAHGAGASVLASALGYLTNYCYAESVGNRRGWRYAARAFHIFSLLAAIAGLVAFFSGAWTLDPV